MDKSYDVRMEEARQYFRDAASEEKNASRRLLAQHLAEMAEAIQEDMRMLDVLKDRIEEIRHTVGVR